jgi:hypothetical protein
VTAGARRVVLFGAAGATAVTVARSIISGVSDGDKISDLIPIRIVIGGTVATVGLLALSDPLPQIASGLAVIMIITSLAWRPSGGEPTGTVLAGVITKRLSDKDAKLSVERTPT